MFTTQAVKKLTCTCPTLAHGQLQTLWLLFLLLYNISKVPSAKDCPSRHTMKKLLAGSLLTLFAFSRKEKKKENE